MGEGSHAFLHIENLKKKLPTALRQHGTHHGASTSQAAMIKGKRTIEITITRITNRNVETFRRNVDTVNIDPRCSVGPDHSPTALTIKEFEVWTCELLEFPY